MWKRVLDVALTLPGLVVLSPVLLLISLLVVLTLGTPILFRQKRPGLRGQPFTLLKFRTMTEGFAADGTPLPDAQRLTRLGKFLRRTSLDELPELLNILKGEMSLVGPRPLLMSYLDRYTPEQGRRHQVKPGITGCAQVNGRNLLSWDEKFRLDVWYVDHVTIWLDLKILGLTFWQVLRGNGISAEGHVTMPEFKGSTTKT